MSNKAYLSSRNDELLIEKRRFTHRETMSWWRYMGFLIAETGGFYAWNRWFLRRKPSVSQGETNGNRRSSHWKLPLRRPVMLAAYLSHVLDKKRKSPAIVADNRASLFALRLLKSGGLLLSRIALQYHRRKRA